MLSLNFLKKVNFFSPSAIISIFLIISFIVLANDQWFIPIELQSNLGFNLFHQPLNALSFLFIHSGIAHLTANVLLILFLGRIVEQSLDKKYVVGLFFGIGILSFAVFNLIYPKLLGIGASGGSIALTTSALILSPKKSFVAFVTILVVALLIMSGVNYSQTILDGELAVQKQITETELTKAIQSDNAVAIKTKIMELTTINKVIEEKKEHKKYEKEIPIANTVHLISSILAIGYLFVFCPVATRKALRQRVVYFRKLFGKK